VVEILCDNGDRIIVRECEDAEDARCIVIEKYEEGEGGR
jgi:hypothetical protein